MAASSRLLAQRPLPRLLEEAVLEARGSEEAQIFTLAERPFHITHVNPAWERLCGFTEAEAVGQTCRILQGPETSLEALNLLQQAVAARATVTVRLLKIDCIFLVKFFSKVGLS